MFGSGVHQKSECKNKSVAEDVVVVKVGSATAEP